MKKLFRYLLSISSLLFVLLTATAFTNPFQQVTSVHAASFSTLKASKNAACGGWLSESSSGAYLQYGFYGQAYLQQETGCSIARGVGCFISPSNNTSAGVVIYVEFYKNGNFVATQSIYVPIPLNQSVRKCYSGAAYSFTPGTDLTILTQYSKNVNTPLGSVWADAILY